MNGSLEAAATIGRRLAHEAVWHGERCNWVGAWPDERRDGGVGITYSALGPDLYGGTAGVALFLAELHRATGDEPELRRTALGAMSQARSAAERLPPGSRASLYSGATGIALAAALIGEPGNVRELLDIGPGTDRPDDLLGGGAGAVLGLLALSALLEEPSLTESALAFGEALLQSGHWNREMLSWPSVGLPGEPHLTGLSHGASGYALALNELARATGESRFSDAADAAFAYERAQFDPGAANWPDLRGLSGGERSFATMWCHGAPGIALARLRARELGGGEAVTEEALIALGTTARAVRQELASGGNFSLCHGLAGNAEILCAGTAAFGDRRQEDLDLAYEVAAEGIERYGGGLDWPCGTFQGTATGMFLGLAGIGRFYLRLHDPSLPSLLAPVFVPAGVGAT